MSFETIILAIIILAAGIYTGRRIYQVLFSKQPPKCTGCSGGCSKITDNSKGDNSHQ